jgi:2Fe-2S ferredoxin
VRCNIPVNATSKIVTFIPLVAHASAKPDETLLDVARRAGAPIGNSCGAVGVCARCKVRVVGGAENLSPPTAIESRIGAQRGFAADERMACQAVVNGDCSVTTTYW